MSEIKVDTVGPRVDNGTLTIGAAGDTVNIAGTAGTGFPAGTTINNNADNKVITGSGSANTLEAEANLLFDGNEMTVQGTPVVVGTNSSSVLDLKNTNSSADGTAVGIAFSTNTGGSANAHITAVQDASAKGTLNFGGYDGTATRNIVMSVDAGIGTVTMPLQPAFMSLNGGGTTLANATDVTITLDTEVFDIGSNISGNTFTAPVTGKYYFSGSVVADAGAGNNTRFSESHIYINCSNRKLKFGEEQHYTNVNDWWAMSVNGLIDMDANDTCTLTYFGRRQSGSGTCVTVGSSTDFRTGLSGYLVA